MDGTGLGTSQLWPSQVAAVARLVPSPWTTCVEDLGQLDILYRRLPTPPTAPTTEDLEDERAAEQQRTEIAKTKTPGGEF